MTLLVACKQCGRQFDASGRPVGDRFRCFCGQVVQIELPPARDMAVMRCPSCGAGAIEGRPSCVFCLTTFSIFDADRTTICPQCMTRCSRVARYCHHCAVPLVADATAGTATDFECPACSTDETPAFEAARMLSSRLVEGITFLECAGCAGLWLEHEAARHIVGRARREAAPYEPVSLQHAVAPFRAGLHPKAIKYRPCPVCGVRMGRINWGRVTGVVVDQCPTHGIWFDHGELEHILAWVRAGGEQQAKKAIHQDEETNRRIAGPPLQDPSNSFHSNQSWDSNYTGGSGWALHAAEAALSLIFRGGR